MTRLRLLLAFTLVALFDFAYCQWSYGIWAGPVVTKGNQSAANELITYQENLISFSGGIYGNHQFPDDFSLEIGVGYLRQEVKYDVNLLGLIQGLGSTLRIMDTFQYLTLPVIAKFSLGEKFNFNTGPQLGILLKSEAEVPIRFPPVNVNTTEFVQDISGNWLFGLEYQGEYKSLGLRGYYGLLDLNDPTSDLTKYKLNMLQLYAKIELGGF